MGIYTPCKQSLGGYIGIALSVCPSVQSKLNLDHNFLTKGDRALILHKCIPCDKTFLLIPKFSTLWPWPWLLTYVWKNLGHNFWTKRERAVIFHMCISCGKTFLLTPKFLTSWPWPWLLKKLNPGNNFWSFYISHVYFLWQNLSVGSKFLLPRDLDFDFWPTFEKNLTLTITFEPKVIGL